MNGRSSRERWTRIFWALASESKLVRRWTRYDGLFFHWPSSIVVEYPRTAIRPPVQHGGGHRRLLNVGSISSPTDNRSVVPGEAREQMGHGVLRSAPVPTARQLPGVQLISHVVIWRTPSSVILFAIVVLLVTRIATRVPPRPSNMMLGPRGAWSRPGGLRCRRRRCSGGRPLRWFG